jgi:hypothetical protein
MPRPLVGRILRGGPVFLIGTRIQTSRSSSLVRITGIAALVVGAIDQETTNARRSHFPEGDFLLAGFYGSTAGESGHALLKRTQQHSANPAIGWAAARAKY